MLSTFLDEIPRRAAVVESQALEGRSGLHRAAAARKIWIATMQRSGMIAFKCPLDRFELVPAGFDSAAPEHHARDRHRDRDHERRPQETVEQPRNAEQRTEDT